MATYSLKQFTRPATLRSIDRKLLLQFLGSHRDFFRTRDAILPDLDDELAEIDYEGLATVFMTPDADTPEQLAEALYFVDEMATEEGMDDLLDEATGAGISFAGAQEPTAADVAVQVWLQAPDRLVRKHGEQFLTSSRSFEYFGAKSQSTALDNVPSRKVLKKLQDALDDWFEEKRRGRGARVFVYPRGAETWFLVRHGDPFRREPSLEGGEPATVFYRPEKHDVVVYNPSLGELRMNARSMGEKDLYRRMFGLHLFGDEEFFPEKGKYTLDPLRTDGAASLVCSDVPGLKEVVLREIHFFWGGPQHEIEVRKADDVFALYNGRQLPNARIIRAKFEMKFDGSKTTRMVKIKPSNIATYKRDSDGEIVDRWLSRRGFVRSSHRADAAA